MNACLFVCGVLCLAQAVEAVPEAPPAAISATTEPILFGPYVQRVLTDEATVVWVSSGRTVTLQTAEETQAREEYRVHSVRFGRLKPDTEYTYNLGEGLSGRFRTAPQGSPPFRFIAFGDTRTREEEHAKVVNAMLGVENVSLVLNTGDLVSSGKNLEHWKSFFRVATPLMQKTLYVPCLGNHEDNAEEFFDFFVLPHNEQWYSFNWGGVHFIALNTEPPAMPDNTPITAENDIEASRRAWEFFAEQRKWLEEDLKANRGASFIVPFFHVPMYDTKLSRRENQLEIRKAFGDLFDEYNVELVLSGHTHNYQHHVRGMSHYVVTGGGGAPLYDLDWGPGTDDVRTVAMEKTTHFLVIDVNGPMMHVQVVRPDASLIEEFDIESQSGTRRVNQRLEALGGLPWETSGRN
jgi:predicted phosphodiesterase